MYFYSISPYLLDLIKKIAVLIHELNKNSLSTIVFHQLETEANALSSYASTSIEGNPLPLTQVKQILKNRPRQIRDTEKEVLNYNDTLLWLKDQLAKKNFEFNEQLVLGVHKRVTKGLLIPAKSGRYRAEPVFVNDPLKRKTIYWPPDHQDVKQLMSKLLDFIGQNKKQLDPLLLAGIFHKQFVIIHPFIDGNGRSVRLLTKVLLADLGLDTFPLFSFENYYNKNVSKYFSNVGVRGNYYDISADFTDWLIYFSEGVLDELERVRKIIENAHVKAPHERPNEFQQKILTYIDQHGTIRDKDYAKFVSRAKATRALDFRKLVELGFIEKLGKGPATYYKKKI
jgi:Fic family protein